MELHKAVANVLSVLAIGFAVAACGDDDGGGDSNRGLPQGSEPAELNPADFSTEIDNPYWPMRPGTRWVLRETDTEGTREKVVIEVTNRTKKIANGIEARVIRDTATDKGVP